MYKPRVVFPFVEAGMGHIMPARSIADAFEKKYGNYATVIRSNFFTESNQKPLITFEKNLVREVKKYNKSAVYGWLNMFAMDIFGTNLLSKVIMDVYIPGIKRAARSHLEELLPDMVVSTHWATAYYAHNIESKPINVSYVPDVQIVPLCSYPNDLTLVSTERGYKRALKKYKKRFNENNLKLVPFAIRNEAFSYSMDKKENRRALGLDENKLTIILFEGGYGIGRTKEITKRLAKSDLDLTIIAICGKNKKLYDYLSTIKPNPNVKLIVEGFCENILSYLSCADIFLGKSGASSVAEPTYFGLAEIITKCATSQEYDNAQYYVKDVKNALTIFSPKKVEKKIREFIENPQLLFQMQNNALKMHDNFGSEKIADILWEQLCLRYPALSSIKIEQ